MSIENPDTAYYKAAMQICKEKREMMGITQEAIALQLGGGYAKETYNRYESPKSNRVPRPGIFASILQILEIDREALDNELQKRGFVVAAEIAADSQDEVDDEPQESENASSLTTIESGLPAIEDFGEQAMQELPLDALETKQLTSAWRRNIFVGVLAVVLLTVSSVLFLHNRSTLHVASGAPSGTIPVTSTDANGGDPVLNPEQQSIAALVKQAEIYECLGIYGHPTKFKTDMLRRYWVPNSTAAEAVIACVKRLDHTKGGPCYYGKGSRYVTFNVRSVQINPSGTTATVKTTESWYLRMYNAKGVRIRKQPAFIPEYPITYVMTKVNGKWLMESNGTWYYH